ncbi:hypothetical protein Tco_1500640 [Tanacetum coccineum]
MVLMFLTLGTLEQFYEDDLEALDLKWNSLCISCGVLQLSSRWGHLPGSALSIKKQGDLDPNSSQHQNNVREHSSMAFSDSEPEFKGYGLENSKKESNVDCEKELDNSKQTESLIRFGKRNKIKGKPQHDDKGFVNSGCSRHMTGKLAYLSDFKQFDGGYVAFGGGAYGGKISSKGTLKTANLDFKDVYFVNELKFNLFSVSQMCDKKNYVLFTDTECLVLSPNFKLPDENQILLKVPRQYVEF